MEKFKNILCFGEVLWDMLPTGAKPGGAPLNVAIHLKRQGLNPHIISKVGNDMNGEKLLNFLKDSGMKTNFIQKDNDLDTSQVLVHIDEHKNATYEICEPVAWDNIIPNQSIIDSAYNADLIVYGSLASRNKTTRDTLFKLLANSKATRLLDVNLRPPYDRPDDIQELLHKSDFIKLNDDELSIIASWNNKNNLTEKGKMKWLATFYDCSAICVTRGANGAILYIENEFFEHRGFSVKAKDTVGAGDSFLASLIASLSKDNSAKQAVEFACATGAFVASQNGAVPHYSINEIENLINTKNN